MWVSIRRRSPTGCANAPARSSSLTRAPSMSLSSVGFRRPLRRASVSVQGIQVGVDAVTLDQAVAQHEDIAERQGDLAAVEPAIGDRALADDAVLVLPGAVQAVPEPGDRGEEPDGRLADGGMAPERRARAEAVGA